MSKYKLPCQSYSSISNFETCPYKWKATYIEKEIKFKPNAATEYGNQVHKAFETRLNSKQKITGSLKHLEPIAEAIEKIPGVLQAEKEIAIDEHGNQVGWWDKSAKERAKLDVFIKQDNGKAIIWDWKTGKYRPNEELEYFTKLTFQTQPDVEKIKTGFHWLQSEAPPPTIKVYTRDDYEELKSKFDGKIEKIKEALEYDNFPKIQSGLCKNYCGSTSCENSGSYDPNHFKKD